MIHELTPLVLVKNDEYWLAYVLESLRGRFERYVIYDVGSKDKTREILEWFISTEPAEFFTRFLPETDPKAQGAFRNSMIAEALTDWYMIVDGDEVYNKNYLDDYFDFDDALETLKLAYEMDKYHEQKTIYGFFRRMEFSQDLTQCYDMKRTHHRLYHRTAIFEGSHPGEAPVIPIDKHTEVEIKDIICYHFHNTTRSSLDKEVPRRIERRSQHTYHPGILVPFNLLKEVPILRQPIENFPVSPELKKLQSEYSEM